MQGNTDSGEWLDDLSGLSHYTIGARMYNNSYLEFFDGTIDEPRISDTDRSAAWMKGTYNSGNDSLFTYGSEETEEVEVNTLFFRASF